jgi:hypothetical protein
MQTLCVLNASVSTVLVVGPTDMFHTARNVEHAALARSWSAVSSGCESIALAPAAATTADAGCCSASTTHSLAPFA